MPAFEVSGIANFSTIHSELQKLNSALGSIKSPKIDVGQPNLSTFFAACDKAEARTIKIKSQIEPPSTLGGGLSSFLNAEKGKFGNVGKELGQSLTMGMQQQFGMAGGVASSFAGALGGVGIAALAGVAGLTALGAAAVSTASSWQTMMAGISKTTGIEGAALNDLSATLQQIRVETGATAEAISGAVTTAGSIGIPKEELAGFAQLSLQMASAFNMAADTAANAMGQIGNVAKPAEMSWTEFTSKAGSSVNALADSMATSEEQILTGMKHLGATMGLLKPPVDTLPAWMALVATVQSLGLTGDGAGEAIQDAMQYATKDAKGAISALLGITNEELQLNLRSNAPAVLQDAAKAIAALPLEQQGAALALFGQTGQKSLALLMGDLDSTTGEFSKLGAAIDASNSSFASGEGLAASYAKSQETFAAATAKLSAALDVAGQKAGTVLLPALTALVEGLTRGVTAATSFGENIYGLFEVATGQKTLDEFDQEYKNRLSGGNQEVEKATEISAKEMGKLSASTYVDEWGNTFETSDYKTFLVDKSKEASTEAGKESADSFGQAYIDKVKEFAKTSSPEVAALLASGGGVDSEGRIIKGMSSNYQAMTIAAKQWSNFNGSGRTGLLPAIGPGTSGTFADVFASYDWKKYLDTDYNPIYKVFDQAGKEISGNFLNEQDIKDQLQSIVVDLPKFFKQQHDSIRKALSDATEDGIITGGENGEKAMLEGLLQQLDALEKEDVKLFASIDGAALRQDVEDSLKGIKITVDTLLKPIYEDWKSGAYREKERYENQDFYKNLTDAAANAWQNQRGELSDVLAAPEGTYSEDQIRQAKNLSAAMDNYEEAVKTGTVATLGMYSNAIDVLSQYGNLKQVMRMYDPRYSKSVGEDITSGNAVGNYFSRGILGAYDPLGHDPGNFEPIGSSNPTIQKRFGEQADILKDGFFETTGSLDKLSEFASPTEANTKRAALATENTKEAVSALGVPLDSIDSKATTTNDLLTQHIAILNTIAGNIALVGNAVHNSQTTSGYPSASRSSSWSSLWQGTPYTGNSAAYNFNSAFAYPPYMPFGFADGGFANSATLGIFGEAGREALVPISNRAAGLKMLPQVLRELGIPQFAGGAILGDSLWNKLLASDSDLNNFGSKTHNAFSGTVVINDNGGAGRDPSASQWSDCVSGACRLVDTTVRNSAEDWNEGIGQSSQKLLRTDLTNEKSIFGESSPDSLLDPSVFYDTSNRIIKELGGNTKKTIVALGDLPDGIGSIVGKFVGGMYPLISDKLLQFQGQMSRGYYLTEFDQYIASTESGLSSCIQSLSDIALMQESGLLGNMFKQSYIGPTDRSGTNYFDLFPEWGPYMDAAFERGLPGAFDASGQTASGSPRAAAMVTPNGMITALDNSQLTAIMQNVETYTGDTSDGLKDVQNVIVDSNDKMLAWQNDMGKWMSSASSVMSFMGGAAGGGWFSGASSAYGSFFGNSWISGGAPGVGQMTSYNGVPESQPSWMPSWTNQARGGFVDGATHIIFGEAGREAFVPISDRAAGLRILPQVMKELGVKWGGGSADLGSGYTTQGTHTVTGDYTVRGSSGHPSTSGYTNSGYGNGGRPGTSGYTNSGYGNGSVPHQSGSYSAGGFHVSSTVIVQGGISSDVHLKKILDQRDKQLMTTMKRAQKR